MSFGAGGQPLPAQMYSAAHWAAPRAEVGRALGDPKHITGKRGAGNLEDQMQATGMAHWAAPTARDAKNANDKPFRERDGGKKGEQLVNQIAHFAPATAHGGLVPSGLIAPMGKRGAPNPAFGCWLMGFPDEWVSGALQAMQSRPSSRRK